MNDFEELYRLTQENYAMLKEILAYVRKKDDPNYQHDEWSREIAFNVIGDIIADNLSPEVVNNVKQQFGMK